MGSLDKPFVKGSQKMAKRDPEDKILEFFKTVFSTYDTNK